jgi:hypothetical protein
VRLELLPRPLFAQLAQLPLASLGRLPS